MAIISREHRICFIHIPRTGGRTIRTLLEKQINDLELIGDLHSSAQETINIFPEVKDYYKFTFVRNPYDRLVSIYSQINTQMEHPDYNEIRRLSFIEFIEWYKEVGMRRKIGDNLPLYNTQSSMMFRKDKLLVDEVFYFEQLCNDMDVSNLNALFTKINLEIPNKVPVLNKSERRIGWLNIFNEQSYTLINRVFEEDFKKLNYKNSYVY